jgi:hypothetical protein
VLCLLILLINIRLLFGPTATPSNIRLLKELRSLKAEIDNGADVRMQHLYPEGYVFLNALYGLAWCNLANASEDRGILYEEAHAQIQLSWERIDSPFGRSSFTRELSPEYGAFYLGWNNYLLAKKLILEPARHRSPSELITYRATSDSIAAALKNHTYPVSYYGAAWPADVVVCVASLAAYDELFDDRYHSLIQDWVSQVKLRYDDHGMIPHVVIPGTGQPDGSARGSSQSLMLILLREIDKGFGEQQFQAFKSNFLATRFGLTGIREFPHGYWKFGDVDSGPIVVGFGAASTIVGATALSVYGDYKNASRISQFIEAVGVPIETVENRYYLLGTLPIADAFIAWGHSLTLNSPEVNMSFVRFHVYSVVALIPLLLFAWILVKPEKPDSTKAMTIGW